MLYLVRWVGTGYSSGVRCGSCLGVMDGTGSWKCESCGYASDHEAEECLVPLGCLWVTGGELDAGG